MSVDYDGLEPTKSMRAFINEQLEGATTKRQCIARSKNTGQRCRMRPILGGYVCIKHGGATTIAKDAAKKRLRAMVDPALHALTSILGLLHDGGCQTCGITRNPQVLAIVGRAAQVVLDRAGFAPTKHVDDTPADDAPAGWEAFLSDSEVEQMAAWVEAAKQRARDAGITIVETEAEVIETVPDEVQCEVCQNVVPYGQAQVAAGDDGTDVYLCNACDSGPTIEAETVAITVRKPDEDI